jgi:hypothetical protein
MLIVRRRGFRIGKKFYIALGILMLLHGGIGALLTMQIHYGDDGDGTAPEPPKDPEGEQRPKDEPIRWIPASGKDFPRTKPGA